MWDDDYWREEELVFNTSLHVYVCAWVCVCVCHCPKKAMVLLVAPYVYATKIETHSHVRTHIPLERETWRHRERGKKGMVFVHAPESLLWICSHFQTCWEVKQLLCVNVKYHYINVSVWHRRRERAMVLFNVKLSRCWPHRIKSKLWVWSVWQCLDV